VAYNYNFLPSWLTGLVERNPEDENFAPGSRGSDIENRLYNLTIPGMARTQIRGADALAGGAIDTAKDIGRYVQGIPGGIDDYLNEPAVPRTPGALEQSVANQPNPASPSASSFNPSNLGFQTEYKAPVQMAPSSRSLENEIRVKRDASGRVISAGNTDSFSQANPDAQAFEQQRGGFVSSDAPAQYTPMYPESAAEKAFTSQAQLAADDPLFRERFAADVSLAGMETRAQGELQARVAAARAAEQAKAEARYGTLDASTDEGLNEQIALIQGSPADDRAKALAIQAAKDKAARSKRSYRLPSQGGIPAEDPLYQPPNG
jgi:hypothetical protein